SADEAPVVKLVNKVLADAIQKGASDIHWESYEKVFRIRFRIDGVLHEMLSLATKVEAATISRLKIMSNLDIAERRVPQDGRIKLRYNTREIDFRVSVLPTIFGEKAVLRILDKDALQLDLSKLGFDPWALEQFEKVIRQPYGMILITGPTGSGKTTTLYSAIHTINSPSTTARLIDMVVLPFLVSSSLLLLLAQRLGRKICKDCKEPYEVDEESLLPYGHVLTGVGRTQVYKGRGCTTCNFTGMKGRVAIYEIMPVTQELRDMIIKGASTAELRGMAQS